MRSQSAIKPYFLCAITIIFSQAIYAKNLGKVGDVWAIQEKNLLAVIEDNLHAHFDGKSEEQVKSEIIKRIEGNVLRPTPTELPRAMQNSERAFDPSYTLDRDLADHNGTVFAKKGTIVNPFSLYRFNQTLVFINADDEAQIKWAKSFKAETEERKMILIKGNIRDAEELLNEQIFFDQHGVLIKRFGIQQVPTVIDEYPNKKLLRIREFAVQ